MIAANALYKKPFISDYKKAMEERLRIRRKQQHLTQEQLTEYLNISINIITKQNVALLDFPLKILELEAKRYIKYCIISLCQTIVKEQCVSCNISDIELT